MLIRKYSGGGGGGGGGKYPPPPTLPGKNSDIANWFVHGLFNVDLIHRESS